MSVEGGDSLKIRCAQCSADIQLERDAVFIQCPYCDSSLYLDRSFTFLHHAFPAKIDEAGARRNFIRFLIKQDVPAPETVQTKSYLLPFWGVRGKGLQETIPAFAPVPVPLAGYLIPTAGSHFFKRDDTTGFKVQEPSDSSSAAWQDCDDVSSFTLYYIPFVVITFGENQSFEVWVDAVTGRIYATVLPPPAPRAVSSRFFTVLSILFILFLCEGLLIQDFGVSFVVTTITAGVAYLLLRPLFEMEGRR